MVFIRVIILAILFGDAELLTRNVNTQMKFEAICKNVTSKSNFEEDKVVGTMWRIYYSWNMIMGDLCMDITFKKVNYAIVEHFRRMMHKHVDAKPNWSNATLVMTMNVSREMLLIPDQKFVVPKNKRNGRFVGVPNIHKGGFLAPSFGSDPGLVSLFKMAMKLHHGGRYLLISDCENGVTSFLVRRDQKHTRAEITSAVATFNFIGDTGYPACKFNLKKKRRHPRQ